ncbi:MAG TPA: tetratricopeptide repeat protein [Candidatus Polarisedimenticolaceae bacterium]|nr:tetratricopeptide repeat protein [Candidatus Polarisedimenticolaceae bacterium]
MRPRPASEPRRAVWLIAGALVLANLGVYAQVAGFDFVRPDDTLYVTRNPQVLAGPTPAGIRWAFTTFEGANWHPLTWLSLMLDARIGGKDPRTFHLVNLLLHAANGLLLFHVLRRMTHAVGSSGLVALLFAVHPLHVESVAWVAERKDVLSTLFWLLTMIAWTRWVERPTPPRYAVALLAFALGLLAKPMLVTLPLVLVLLDFWPLRRMRAVGGVLVEKLPFLALAAASCLVTLHAQRAGGALGSFEAYPLGLRLANAALACVRYVGMAFVPSGLAYLYPYDFHPPAWKVAGAVLLLAALTAGAIFARVRRPHLAVGWFWYLGTLVPVLGLVQVGTQPLADRYTYVPLIGLAIAVVWGAGELLGLHAPAARSRRVVAGVVAGIVVAALAAAAHVQAGYWRDSEALFARALAATSGTAEAHNGLAVVREGQGRLDEAIAQYREALRLAPHSVFAHQHLGGLLAARGEADGAVHEFREVLQYARPNADVLADLGLALTQLRQLDEAETRFRQALQLAPDHLQAHRGIAVVLGRAGRTDEAIAHQRRAVELDPQDATAHANLASLLMNQAKDAEAEVELRAALQLDPQHASARRKLAQLLSRRGAAE